MSCDLMYVDGTDVIANRTVVPLCCVTFLFQPCFWTHHCGRRGTSVPSFLRPPNPIQRIHPNTVITISFNQTPYDTMFHHETVSHRDAFVAPRPIGNMHNIRKRRP
jgi:hypothetical protein